MSNATLNGQALTFTPSHRPGFITTPVIAAVSLSVELDRDDVVAALFAWDDTDMAELEDDDHARMLIVEAVVNIGLGELENIRCGIADGSAVDTADLREWLAFCRRRAAELFPVAPAPRRQARRTVETTTAARELVTA